MYQNNILLKNYNMRKTKKYANAFFIFSFQETFRMIRALI